MSRLRTWMVRFHGVGTAYLANYLGWMRMMEDKGNKKSLSLDMLLSSSFYFS
jgi:hypothetical protein